MNEMVTKNELSGRAIGALFFAGFGTLWILLALYLMQKITMANVSLVAAILTVLGMTGLWLIRRAKHFPAVTEDPALRKAFQRINILQWVTVFLVSFTFGRLHWDAYVLCAIGVIVGLHMFPLARLFHYPMHYATGGALVAWAIGTAFVVPAEDLQGISAVGIGILLWVSSWITLLLGIKRSKRETVAWVSDEAGR